jgi:RNA recognition motif-containing protein
LLTRRAPQTSVLIRNMPREFPRQELEDIFSKFGAPCRRLRAAARPPRLGVGCSRLRAVRAQVA